MKVLMTGAAGFIGYHTVKALLSEGHEVFGVDSLNSYYSPILKQLRLADLLSSPRFRFQQMDICDSSSLESAWSACKPSHVIHLAAQAGVRYSLEAPLEYIHSNILGFQVVIELVRKFKPANFVYASSSSVYGGHPSLPFRESHDVSNPVSLYAATKVSNELVARTYGHLFGLPNTGLRFFTVYGPLGRPDMAYFKFSECIAKGKAIPVFRDGTLTRDYTYVDDIVKGLLAAVGHPRVNAVYNLGRGQPLDVLSMIRILEKHLGCEARIDFQPFQLGDVEATLADISLAKSDLGYEPKVSLDEGLGIFVEWYREWSDFQSGRSTVK